MSGNAAVSGNKVTDSGGGVFVKGIFNMEGGLVANNEANVMGGGVVNQGTFDMTGGTISDNTANMNGGGVYANLGIFTMRGNASISGNEAKGGYSGGGVYVVGTFNMEGGSVSNNKGSHGGGVCLNPSATFTMTGGEVSNNTTAANGGGVCIGSGTFTMNDGKLSGNTANGNYGGGGVYAGGGRFRIVTGTVYGTGEGDLSNKAPYNSDSAALYSIYTNTRYGTFSVPGDVNSTWTPTNDANSGTLNTRNETIRVLNGVLQ